MKKLVMAFAVVFAAVAAQAAVIKWSTGTLYGVNADGSWNTTVKAYADGGSYSIAIQLLDKDGALLESANSTTVSSLSAMTGTFEGEYEFNTPYKVAISMTYTGSTGAEQTMALTAAAPFTTKGTGQTTANFTTLGLINSSATQFTEAVPEPTSGLLLLLGMAGLALRRKQK